MRIFQNVCHEENLLLGNRNGVKPCSMGFNSPFYVGSIPTVRESVRRLVRYFAGNGTRMGAKKKKECGAITRQINVYLRRSFCFVGERIPLVKEDCQKRCFPLSHLQAKVLCRRKTEGDCIGFF
ncbi:MAG: hypothetical protein E7616_05010 [Ruminococcaceae bacterium]|nr:hypothetical protein [Oscillospiraceae bacterium]